MTRPPNPGGGRPAARNPAGNRTAGRTQAQKQKQQQQQQQQQKVKPIIPILPGDFPSEYRVAAYKYSIANYITTRINASKGGTYEYLPALKDGWYGTLKATGEFDKGRQMMPGPVGESFHEWLTKQYSFVYDTAAGISQVNAAYIKNFVDAAEKNLKILANKGKDDLVGFDQYELREVNNINAIYTKLLDLKTPQITCAGLQTTGQVHCLNDVELNEDSIKKLSTAITAIASTVNRSMILPVCEFRRDREGNIISIKSLICLHQPQFNIQTIGDVLGIWESLERTHPTLSVLAFPVQDMSTTSQPDPKGDETVYFIGTSPAVTNLTKEDIKDIVTNKVGSSDLLVVTRTDVVQYKAKNNDSLELNTLMSKKYMTAIHVPDKSKLFAYCMWRDISVISKQYDLAKSILKQILSTISKINVKQNKKQNQITAADEIATMRALVVNQPEIGAIIGEEIMRIILNGNITTNSDVQYLKTLVVKRIDDIDRKQIQVL